MTRIFLLMLLLTMPIAATAHGPAPAAQHGGVVAETSDEHWLELVMTGNDITIYVADQANKLIASVGLTAKATILAGGKTQQVALTPATANTLVGKLETSASGKVTAAISLSIGSKASQARFTITRP